MVSIPRLTLHPLISLRHRLLILALRCYSAIAGSTAPKKKVKRDCGLVIMKLNLKRKDKAHKNLAYNPRCALALTFGISTDLSPAPEQ